MHKIYEKTGILSWPPNFCSTWVNLPNLHGTIFRTIQHYAAKIGNFTKFSMFFSEIPFLSPKSKISGKSIAPASQKRTVGSISAGEPIVD